MFFICTPHPKKNPCCLHIQTHTYIRTHMLGFTNMSTLSSIISAMTERWYSREKARPPQEGFSLIKKSVQWQNRELLTSLLLRNHGVTDGLDGFARGLLEGCRSWGFMIQMSSVSWGSPGWWWHSHHCSWTLYAQMRSLTWGEMNDTGKPS